MNDDIRPSNGATGGFVRRTPRDTVDTCECVPPRGSCGLRWGVPVDIPNRQSCDISGTASLGLPTGSLRRRWRRVDTDGGDLPVIVRSFRNGHSTDRLAQEPSVADLSNSARGSRRGLRATPGSFPPPCTQTFAATEFGRLDRRSCAASPWMVALPGRRRTSRIPGRPAGRAEREWSRAVHALVSMLTHRTANNRRVLEILGSEGDQHPRRTASKVASVQFVGIHLDTQCRSNAGPNGYAAGGRVGRIARTDAGSAFDAMCSRTGSSRTDWRDLLEVCTALRNTRNPSPFILPRGVGDVRNVR